MGIREAVTKQWRAERRRDKYYVKAKKEHYRSRAVYKLKQIDHRFDLIRPGNVVVDLGASPGGWSEIASELVGAQGRVIAMDIDRMSPIEGVTFIRGDIRNEAVISRLRELIPDGVDVVISDMSPDISGNYSYDHARSVELCEHALRFAATTLKEGGNFAAKMFYGDMSKGFVDLAKNYFHEVHLHHPKASRSTSSEIYVIGLEFRVRRASPRTA